MYMALLALLVWMGPHTPCVWAQPYDGEPAVSDPHHDGKRPIDFLAGGGLLQEGPDRQSATACAPPEAERAS